MTSRQKIRILLVDDHETVREGLRAILGSQDDLTIVGEAADGRAAVAQAVELGPDVVIMDVSLPTLNGLKATEALKQSCPHVQVLAFTRHSDDGYLQEMLRAGASGYVLKQSPTVELLHAIRSVATGGKYLDPAVAGRVFTFSARTPSTRGSEVGPALSPREEEVLRLVARGYSNKEIATRLTLSVKTVETHKANAMQKLLLRSRVDVVRFAVLHGWLEDR